MNDGFERNCNQMFHLLNLKQKQIVTQTAGWWQTTTSLRRNKQLLPDSSLVKSRFIGFLCIRLLCVCVRMRVPSCVAFAGSKVFQNFFKLLHFKMPELLLQLCVCLFLCLCLSFALSFCLSTSVSFVTYTKPFLLMSLFQCWLQFLCLT